MAPSERHNTDPFPLPGKNISATNRPFGEGLSFNIEVEYSDIDARIPDIIISPNNHSRNSFYLALARNIFKRSYREKNERRKNLKVYC